jgi:CheY-like chemotaxis protein
LCADGRGAKVNQRLTLAKAQRVGGEQIMKPEATMKRGKRILVVDDEAAVRETLKVVLEMDGHIVTEAVNGRDACLIFAPQDFDLIITDYNMPEMKGDELARTIKCLVPGQRIIMLTAHAAEACSGENPVDAVLEKPFTLTALRQMIAALPVAGAGAAATQPGQRVDAGHS